MNTERPEPEYNLGMYVAYKCRRRGDDKERDYKMLITWHPVFIEGQDNPEPCWHYIGDLFEMSGDEVCAKANLVPEGKLKPLENIIKK